MRRLSLLIVVLAYFQSFGVVAQDMVPEAAVVEHLTRSFGNPGRFGVTAMKQFPDGTSGTGRISVAATLTFDATYVRTTGVDDALRAAGFSADEIDFYGAALGIRPASGFAFDLYDVEHPQGDVVPFTAEYYYRETVSGFDFLGTATLQFRGKKFEDLPAGAMVVGSDDFTALLNRFRDARATRLASMAEDLLRMLRSDARRILAKNGIGNIITREGDTIAIEILDPNQKKAASLALQRLTASDDSLGYGGVVELEFGETADGRITIGVIR